VDVNIVILQHYTKNHFSKDPRSTKHAGVLPKFLKNLLESITFIYSGYFQDSSSSSFERVVIVHD